MLRAENIVGGEWVEWYRMTPQERFRESAKLFQIYQAHGGSLDPEPDPESPFFDAEEWRATCTHGRQGVQVSRKCGVQLDPKFQ